VSKLQDVGGLPYALAHKLIWHSTSGMSNAGVYDKWSFDEMASAYARAMNSITIGVISPMPNDPPPMVTKVQEARRPELVQSTVVEAPELTTAEKAFLETADVEKLVREAQRRRQLEALRNEEVLRKGQYHFSNTTKT
jgi:hypothetical protein